LIIRKERWSREGKEREGRIVGGKERRRRDERLYDYGQPKVKRGGRG
jgi:hypothetical protein